MTIDSNLYQHCLRPLFTENIVKILQKSTSVNLIGDSGQGRGRLLGDIQKLSLDNTLILQVNMRTCKENYVGFIRELWRQLKNGREQPTDLGQLMTQFEESGKKILILLHNFDSLLNNPQIDKRFDVAFFDHLNAMRNHAQLSLLCVTCKPHDQSVVFIDEKAHSNSWLDLEKRRIPPLTHEQIDLELKRRNLGLSDENFSQSVDCIHKNSRPYDFLEFLCHRIEFQEDIELDFSRRLKKWKKRFRDEHLTISMGMLSKIAQFFNALGTVTGISKLKTPFVLVLDFLSKFVNKK